MQNASEIAIPHAPEAFLSLSFRLDSVIHRLYVPATQRQAVSIANVGTDHPAAFIFRDCRAPPSTNAAQTLSIIARQCQDDFSSPEHVLLRSNSDA